MPTTAPAFLETSPSVLQPELIAQAEATLGKTLYASQLERLLINVIAYRESLVRLGVQDAAEQCLVEFARGAFLEAIGAGVGVTRLPAAKATTTLRITLPVISGADTTFAADWGAMAPENQVFLLVNSAVIPAGQLFVDAAFEAETAGSAGNDIPSGSTFTALEGSVTLASTVISSGGAEIETDDALRVRIQDAPSQFSAAGSAAAYRYHALSASPDIIEVAVDSPTPGVVGVYPLVKDGLPTEATLDLVAAALNADRVRPICDLVQVQAPTRVPWVLDATLTLLRSADASQSLVAAQAAAEAFAADRRAGLGRDLVGSQVIAALSVPGIYKVTLNDWTDRDCLSKDWADCTAIMLHLAPGRADG